MKKLLLKKLSNICLKKSVGTLSCASANRVCQPKAPKALNKFKASKRENA
ncbi:hypothetical protein M2475_002123 [Breznakia sp. PF5-3]|nr:MULTISPECIES: hypothetical protein [unclassified Breznakia]MDL2276661.1 hypothetical protein [Breznakia sp. OttesenSCG-928-G09]MDF9825712.1 hypothetical protein [Breznakia sp. PM6-1]MDF9836542.1 hypothetical protein [Breznakia sp. PF5-3]MDF9838347.1 hypothetical protein [Breznakia sp. PFB2-8]MDF9860361.1 hypothetical protein [Breznakia sp. PH5-24]